MNTGMTEYIGSTVLLLLVCQAQKVVGGPSGGLWLADERVHETSCVTQSSSDLTYSVVVSGLPVLRRIILELCLFKGNISLVLRKWVKNGKGWLRPSGKACWERAGKEGGSFVVSVSLQSDLDCCVSFWPSCLKKVWWN